MTLPLLSRPVLDDLGGVIGAEKLRRLIVRFTDSLRTAFPAGSRPPGEIAREAHTLISMSGMLGCERLSTACRALEAEAKDGADLAPALAEIRALRDETVRALEDVAQTS
ncbi:Hpt domain-containing protein [Methylobacterium sp. E-041]|uniref:Hpt domain-containing protein n=1 Tax=unclassified Methylobacterium TaxID=2615210 RepID=UPI001FBBA39A|nr:MULTISPECIES: Hpt domain-containing protein [unclassified Methylobacterium]MCJ2107789.1 Hpt domain-containing protein [Methylobacterium sp. E-041]MCJ2112037.1 Hpt domain-containing protein [Methylobacterium sp. E-025]